MKKTMYAATIAGLLLAASAWAQSEPSAAPQQADPRQLMTLHRMNDTQRLETDIQALGQEIHQMHEMLVDMQAKLDKLQPQPAFRSVADPQPKQ